MTVLNQKKVPFCKKKKKKKERKKEKKNFCVDVFEQMVRSLTAFKPAIYFQKYHM
jgi:hypothetical protein